MVLALSYRARAVDGNDPVLGLALRQLSSSGGDAQGFAATWPVREVQDVIACLIIAAWFGFVVCYTGPAFEERRKRRQERREFPVARAKYLPAPTPVCSICYLSTCVFTQSRS